MKFNYINDRYFVELFSYTKLIETEDYIREKVVELIEFDYFEKRFMFFQNLNEDIEECLYYCRGYTKYIEY